MGDLINTLTSNPLIIVFGAFIVFCLIKGGNSKKGGNGKDNSSNSSNSSKS